MKLKKLVVKHSIVVDIRSEEMIQNAVNKTVETFGGIDILINNASAISLTPIEQTTQKRYDLNARDQCKRYFLVSKSLYTTLKKIEKSSYSHPFSSIKFKS